MREAANGQQQRRWCGGKEGVEGGRRERRVQCFTLVPPFSSAARVENRALLQREREEQRRRGGTVVERCSGRGQ